MKIFFSIILFSILLFPQNNNYVIVIHGGAGNLSELNDSAKIIYKQALTEALKIGKEVIKNNGSAIDVVEKVITYLEDNPLFNAGKGAVFTSENTHELDASIMSGVDLSCGAVAGIKHIKNPIQLARLVMEKTPHVLLISDGAEKFAKSLGINLVDNSYFDTERTLAKWKEYKERIEKQKKGTVGCVVLDKNGNLAAGTSTGGLQNKMPGRIGDSPLINAGTYANNKTCAVSCTGEGELFIKNTVAYNMSALMEYKDLSLNQAAEEIINKHLHKDAGGLIAVDRDGNYVAKYNTQGMFFGVLKNDEINIGF